MASDCRACALASMDSWYSWEARRTARVVSPCKEWSLRRESWSRAGRAGRLPRVVRSRRHFAHAVRHSASTTGQPQPS